MAIRLRPDQDTKRPRRMALTSSSITAGGLLGTLGMAPETASRLTWWTSKVLSLDNADPATALSEALQILAWCALPSVVGAVVGASVSAVVTAGVERALTSRERSLRR